VGMALEGGVGGAHIGEVRENIGPKTALPFFSLAHSKNRKMAADSRDVEMTLVNIESEGKGRRGSEMSMVSASLAAASSKVDSGNAVKLARGYKKSEGEGFTAGEVMRLAEDMEAEQQRNKRMSREVVLLAGLVVFLSAAMFGCSWAVVVLTRETEVNEDHVMVDVKDGQPISVHEATYTSSIMDLVALDPRGLASVESLSFTAVDVAGDESQYDVTFFVTSTVKQVVGGETWLTVKGAGRRVEVIEGAGAIYTSSDLGDPCSSPCAVAVPPPDDARRRALQMKFATQQHRQLQDSLQEILALWLQLYSHLTSFQDAAAHSPKRAFEP